MTKEKIYMKDVLQRLLNPKEILDVRLFNYDQQLKPEIRDFLIKEVIHFVFVQLMIVFFFQMVIKMLY